MSLSLRELRFSPNLIYQCWYFFHQIALSALRKDKAYLAVGPSAATSTIRRQQEASQALALSTS